MLHRIKNVLKRNGKRFGLYPKDRFALICHQRSGSNMLGSIIGNHPDVVYYGQLYKDTPDHRKRLDALAGMKLPIEPLGNSMEQRDRFYQADGPQTPDRGAGKYTEQFFERAHARRPERYVGIKFHGATLYESEIRDLYMGGRSKVILLHRKNLLAAAISWYQAREIDQWRRNKDEKVEQPTLRMEVERLQWFMDNTRRDVALWQHLIQDTGTKALELTYEDVSDDPVRYGRQVFDYLGLRSLPDARPQTKKLIKTYDHIENIEQIRRTLANSTNGIV